MVVRSFVVHHVVSCSRTRLRLLGDPNHTQGTHMPFELLCHRFGQTGRQRVWAMTSLLARPSSLRGAVNSAPKLRPRGADA
jgi:hypothetical protein